MIGLFELDEEMTLPTEGTTRLLDELIPVDDASDVESICLKGCLLFLLVENGVIGAFGRSRFLCGNFSISFFLVVDCRLSSAFRLLMRGVAYKLEHMGVVSNFLFEALLMNGV